MHLQFSLSMWRLEINNKLPRSSAMKYCKAYTAFAVTLNTPLLFKPPQKLRDFRDDEVVEVTESRKRKNKVGKTFASPVNNKFRFCWANLWFTSLAHLTALITQDFGKHDFPNADQP